MSVKRVKDPAGILPDRVQIDLTDSDGPDEAAAIHSLLESKTPGARIQRVRRHPELAEWADEAEALYTSAGCVADWHLLEAIAQAEYKALYLDVAGIAVRDRKRQDGTRKERRPDISAWIDVRLRRDPKAKSPELWTDAPDWIKDQLGERRFATRVTERRKKRASK